MTRDISDAFVFFGATGDLAYKQIFPALQELVRRGTFNMPVVGVAKSDWDLEKLKERARESIQKNGKFNEADYEKLCRSLKYIDGDYNDQATYEQLRTILGDAKNVLYYLCIPPALFSTVAEGLQNAGCINNSRVVVEKPFGRDLASAKELNKTLHRFFSEENIYRIDHFLGKEPVQNIVYFRFANSMIEACWNNRHIESVQITMAEQFGVDGRGALYDELGCIRDVVQNHILQLIACLAMECPCGNDVEAKRNERGKVLKSLRKLTKDDVVRGQFRGYKSEKGVAADSTIETFAALRFHIDNERWQGIPFYVRAGKCLPVTITEAIVQFKNLGSPVLDETTVAPDSYYRFRFGTDELIAFGVQIKTPGERMIGEPLELIAHAKTADVMPPYVRLLGDASKGDESLFAREDSVEESWRAIDQILEDGPPIQEYDQGTWGPDLAGKLEPPGGWCNPEP